MAHIDQALDAPGEADPVRGGHGREGIRRQDLALGVQGEEVLGRQLGQDEGGCTADTTGRVLKLTGLGRPAGSREVAQHGLLHSPQTPFHRCEPAPAGPPRGIQGGSVTVRRAEFCDVQRPS